MVHLGLLPEGEAILKQARPSELFNQASSILRGIDFSNHEEVFVKALTALQKANKSQSFGLCNTCKYFTKSPEGYKCDLTKGMLSQSDSEKICQEHTVL